MIPQPTVTLRQLVSVVDPAAKLKPHTEQAAQRVIDARWSDEAVMEWAIAVQPSWRSWRQSAPA